MATFKKGDKVICKDDSTLAGMENMLVKGNIYTIEGFLCCPSCGVQTIALVEISGEARMHCPCGDATKERRSYRISRFEKPASFGELIEYRKKVTEPEVLKTLTPAEIQNH